MIHFLRCEALIDLSTLSEAKIFELRKGENISKDLRSVDCAFTFGSSAWTSDLWGDYGDYMLVRWTIEAIHRACAISKGWVDSSGTWKRKNLRDKDSSDRYLSVNWETYCMYPLNSTSVRSLGSPATLSHLLRISTNQLRTFDCPLRFPRADSSEPLQRYSLDAIITKYLKPKPSSIEGL